MHTRLRRSRIQVPWSGWWVTLYLLLVITPAIAQEPAKKPDIRLVIDVSGSMKITDPHDLRQPAVELLVRLMPDGGKAGVWTFGKYVNMLVPHQQVDDNWRDLARSKGSEINSVGLFTNIGAALEKAGHDATQPSDPNYVTSIILLTDGMVDISKDPAANATEWRRIVEEVLPTLKDAEYTIHTVALSEKADTELMEKLAVSTDGTSAVVRNAEDLMKVFLDAFSIAAPAQELPLQNNRFAVDSSVDEFTALVFRKNPEKQTQLIGPDEQRFDVSSTHEDLKWFRSDRYDLVTVKQPLEGEWQLIADLDPASRVTVVSDLSLRVKQVPNNVFLGAGESLSFVLLEEGATVTSAEFLSLLDAKVTLQYVASEEVMQPYWSHSFSDSPPPVNGIYTVQFPDFTKMGVYNLALVVDGKTFKRQFTHRITVREPFTASLDETVDENGQLQYVLSVRSHSDLIDPQKTQIAATITKPNKRKLVKPLGVTENQRWQTLLHTDQAGDYRISVQVIGEDNNQQSFEYTLSPIVMSHNPDAVFTAPEPEPIPEPEPEPAPEPEPEPQPEPEEASDGLPPWLFYLLLGVGNLIILGGGYLLFRRSMGHGDEGEATEAAEGESEQAPAQEDFDEGLMMMDDGSDSEEEPPMEDLDTIETDELMAAALDDDEPDDLDEADEDVEKSVEDLLGLNDDFADEDEVVPELNDVLDGNEDAGDDLEEQLMDKVVGGASAEEKAEFAEEMLKAQGLDLADDELDDAISNLISELDGSREQDEAKDQNDENTDDDDPLLDR